MGLGWAWERCVREIVFTSDPAKVSRLAVEWRALADDLMRMAEDHCGHAAGSAYNASGAAYQTVGGLTGALSAWRGPGGAAYIEHVNTIGKEVSLMGSDAMQVSSALSRIAQDLQKSVSAIPIPVRTSTSWAGEGNYSLPNKTALGNAWDSKSASAIGKVLRADYASNPAGYADGAFRKIADDLESTVKMGAKNWGYDARGGVYDSKSFLNDWYQDCTKAAQKGADPVPSAIYDERPNLYVTPTNPDTGGESDSDQNRRSSNTTSPFGPGTDSSGYSASSGLPGLGAASAAGSGWSPDSAYSPLGDPAWTGADPSPADLDGSGLAGVAGSGLVGVGGAGGAGSLGGVGSLGAGSGGGLPGLISSGAKGVSPMTSPAAALNAAMGGRTSGAAGAGGMAGGAGRGAGGSQGERGGERRTRLIEEDSPWKLDTDVPPGVIM